MSRRPDPEFSTLVELADQSWHHTGKVDLYTQLAQQLSYISRRLPPWSWRYIQSVASGTLRPSPALRKATRLLGAQLDGAPDLGETEAVIVYAQPGKVKSGTLILGESRRCALPGCGVWFLPRTWNQIYHDSSCRSRDYQTRGRR